MRGEKTYLTQSHSRAQQPSHVVSEAHAGGRRPALPAWEHPSTMRETPGGAQPARAGEPPRVTYPTPLALGTPPNVVEWSSSSSTPMLPSTDDRSTLSASKPPTMKGEPGPSDVHQGLGKKQAVTRAELRPARRTEQWATSAGVEWGTSPYAEDAGAVGGTEWEVGDSYAAGKDPDTGDLGDMNDWREWNAPFDDDDAHEPSGGVPLDVGPSAKPKETRDDRRDGKARQEHERKKKPQGDTHDGQKKKPPSIRPSGREKAKAKPRASTFQAPKHHRDNSKAANAERHHYDFASDEWKKLRKEHFKDIPLMEIGPEAELASNPAFRSLRCRVDDLEGRVEQLTRMLAQAEAIAMDARRVVQQFESDRANDRYLRTLKMDDLERDVDILKIDVRTTESKQNQCSQRLQQLSTASKDVVDIAERRETQLQAIVEDTVGRLKTATLCAEKATKHINDVEERLRAEMEAKYELEEKRTRATRAELFSDLQFTHDFQGQLARDVDMIKNLHVRTMEWEFEIEDLDSAMMSPMFTMSGVRDMQLVLYPKGSKSHKSGSSLYVRAPLGSHFRFRLFVHHLGPANTANPPFVSDELECVFDQENDRGCHTVGCFLFGQVVCVVEFLENLTPGNPWMPVMRLVKPELHTTGQHEPLYSTGHAVTNQSNTARSATQSRPESPVRPHRDAPQPNDVGNRLDARTFRMAGCPESPLQIRGSSDRLGSALEEPGISREHNVAERLAMLKDPDALQESKLDEQMAEFRDVLRERSTRLVDHVTNPPSNSDRF